jgi:hypothetical protein
MAKRRRHTEEFKRDAVMPMESRGSRSIRDVAEDLGISGEFSNRGGPLMGPQGVILGAMGSLWVLNLNPL